MRTTDVHTTLAILKTILHQVDPVIWAATGTKSRRHLADENLATQTPLTQIGGRSRLLLTGFAAHSISTAYSSVIG